MKFCSERPVYTEYFRKPKSRELKKWRFERSFRRLRMKISKDFVKRKGGSRLG